eukprot:1037093-Prymnesium_polylepis.1
MAVEVVRRVLAVASGIGARALGKTAQQRRHRRSEYATGNGRCVGQRLRLYTHAWTQARAV